MSTVKSKNVQIGTSLTATDNFTVYQPTSPDGTLRIGNGNAGSVTDIITATSSGNVGIGTSSPSNKLTLADANALSIQLSSALSGGSNLLLTANGTGGEVNMVNGLPLLFKTGNTERLRIDSSGNVGIGTSSPGGYKLNVAGSLISTYAQVNNGTTNEFVGMSLSNRYTSGEGVSFIDSQGQNGVTDSHIFFGHQADFGSNIRFATQPAGTNTDRRVERMRIGSSGQVGIGMAPAGTVRLAVASGTAFIMVGRNSAGTTDQIRIDLNGSVTNTFNSYAGISDIKLKENIVDATPKLDKLNQVRVVNYNLKTNPDQKLLGVVAQELEQIFPGLIDETVDRDEEGNDLGTTTKSVKYSVFVPMLIKAIQELNAKVESLQAQLEAK